MRSPNDCRLLWTYLGHNCLVTNLVWSVTASLKEPPTRALHHPPCQPAEQEEFARASDALARVTYKEFIPGGPGPPPLLTEGTGEEESLLGVPGGHVVVLGDKRSGLWQLLHPSITIVVI